MSALSTADGVDRLCGILASLAAFERDLIRERTAAGLAAARERGRFGGRPPSMTPEKLEVARRMLAEGRPKTIIAKTIGVSRPTLYEHLGLLVKQREDSDHRATWSSRSSADRRGSLRRWHLGSAGTASVSRT